MQNLVSAIEENCKQHADEPGGRLYEHLRYRIKSDESMHEKLARNGFEPTAQNALRSVTDAIGLRIVCLFIDDVYENIALIKSLPGCAVVQEKDYIQDDKPCGRRSDDSGIARRCMAWRRRQS